MFSLVSLKSLYLSKNQKDFWLQKWKDQARYSLKVINSMCFLNKLSPVNLP